MTEHVWSRIDLRFAAARTYDNPYADVDVWVDLEGPAFNKRVYGFWNGGQEFVVRVLATAPGTWHWTVGQHAGRCGAGGQERQLRGGRLVRGRARRKPQPAWHDPRQRRRSRARICRRHAVFPHRRHLVVASRATASRLTKLAMTKPLSAGCDAQRPRRTTARRRATTASGLIAAHPAWANDGQPPLIQLADGTWVRAAWKQPGTSSAKDMHNEGGRPFVFPGKRAGLRGRVSRHRPHQPGVLQGT